MEEPILTECVICYKNKRLHTIRCGHSFCYYCIFKMECCAICRSPIYSKKIELTPIHKTDEYYSYIENVIQRENESVDIESIDVNLYRSSYISDENEDESRSSYCSDSSVRTVSFFSNHYTEPYSTDTYTVHTNMNPEDDNSMEYSDSGSESDSETASEPE
jgi:hypothetical protein